MLTMISMIYFRDVLPSKIGVELHGMDVAIGCSTYVNECSEQDGQLKYDAENC